MNLTHLKQLEAESIFIIREVAACFEKPCMFYSIGKDSTVMLHLARKAFWPGNIPFTLLHIDTTWEFAEMARFRDNLGGCPRIRYSNDYLLMGFRKNLNYPDAKLQIDQILHSFLLKLVHIGLIQSIFTYIAGFTVKFPNSGRINPVIMALAIFLKLCAAQTIENSPATFSLPRTLKPRKPLFLI